LKMLDWRYPPEEGRNSLSSRELQSILCNGAPSDRNPGHEDQLQEPPPTQVSGGNVASEAYIENVSDVRIVDNEAHQICGVQVPVLKRIFFFERIRISNLIRNPENFRIRIRILFVVRKFSNPNPNIRDSEEKIRIRIQI